jgi:hypothetical protein
MFWLRYIASEWTSYKTPFLTSPGGFAASLPSNGRHSIVECQYVAGLFNEPLPKTGLCFTIWMWLPSALPLHHHISRHVTESKEVFIITLSCHATEDSGEVHNQIPRSSCTRQSSTLGNGTAVPLPSLWRSVWVLQRVEKVRGHGYVNESTGQYYLLSDSFRQFR